MLSVLILTVIGSFTASFLPERAMGSTMQVALIFIGLRFLIKPVTTTKEQMNSIPPKERVIKSVLGGILIGFICGFVGAGGGMMMLIAACLANKADAKTLNRVVGIVMILTSIAILIVNGIK